MLSPTKQFTLTAIGNILLLLFLIPVHANGTTVVVIPLTSYEKGVETVTSAGHEWMDRNLGAQRPALNLRDLNAYGGYFQWGRLNDGHAFEISPTTTDLSDTDEPEHNSFIRTSPEPVDWRFPQNNNLWQGANGTNNPCPQGFRVPTRTEWQTEMNSWDPISAHTIFSSPLKLSLAGYRSPGDGSFGGQGMGGYYWSSTVTGERSYCLFFIFSDADIAELRRAFGATVRCIKD